MPRSHPLLPVLLVAALLAPATPLPAAAAPAAPPTAPATPPSSAGDREPEGEVDPGAHTEPAPEAEPQAEPEPQPGDRSGFPTGELVEGVECLADPTQTYTLYLPSAYTPERRWPLLLVFDPRGRSRLAAELFREGAETYGWIVLSSDGTRSDGPMGPNQRALDALLPELDRRWPVDPRRVYAAGFSGGAHLAWLLGRTGALAGVIASGGRAGPAWMVDDIPFASYGAAGSIDFNRAGMRAVSEHFAARGAPHRLEIFEGVHQWLPAPLALSAMGWLEVVAMRQGRRPVDPELVAERFGHDLARAEELAASGQPLLAARHYRSVLRTYEGMVELEAARHELATLEASREHRVAEKEKRRWDEYEQRYRSRLGRVLAEIRAPEIPMPASRIAHRLDIERLERMADEGGYRGTTARRLLATVFTQTAFYLTRDFLAAGDSRRAQAVLEVATRIAPGQAGAWYNLACARALSGRGDGAVEALHRAIDAGYADLEHLRTDPDLESLRDRDDWPQLLARLKG